MKLPAFLSAVVLAAAAPAAFAQTELIGINDIDDQIDDVQRETDEDIARGEDARRFGRPDQREGLSGSASLSFSGISGETDREDLAIGARLTDVRGPFAQTLGFVVNYSDGDPDDDGDDSDVRDIFFIYDATYDFNDRFYGFVLGRGISDGLADEDGETAKDGFLGVGPGYRVIASDRVAWRVQAGLGVSYLENGIGEEETELGAIASSRLYVQISDNVFATNDTDILNSDTALRVNNDFGINFQVSDAFSTRLSYLTEYNDSRDVETENRLGFSLVYGF